MAGGELGLYDFRAYFYWSIRIRLRGPDAAALGWIEYHIRFPSFVVCINLSLKG
jgi:hypothetical protein